MANFGISFVLGANTRAPWSVVFTTPVIDEVKVCTAEHHARILVKPCGPLFWFLSHIGDDMQDPESMLSKGLKALHFYKSENLWRLEFDTNYVPCNLIVEEPDEYNS